MRRNFFSKPRIFPLFTIVATLAGNALAQAEKEAVDGSSDRWIFMMFFVVAVGLGGAAYFWRKSKKGLEEPKYNYENRYSNYYNNESYNIEGVDAEKELEWLRKAKKQSSPSAKMTFGPKKTSKTDSKPTVAGTAGMGGQKIDTKDFQERMRKLQYAQLPINSFSKLSTAKQYEPLPESNDPSVLSAIEQVSEEFEEDEAVRELSLRILTAFRTRNSIEALSQIALYDLSSNLRSKAVTTLTDFDHESVFEPLLLACADPTREVRAASARGLFRLNFDRADAWKRIIETGDEFRRSHAARAAIESGIVVKSFDRLVHDDIKVAYEAFALVSLMIKAGETREILDAIKTHKDERVKFALLHVLRVHKDERIVPQLHNLLKSNILPPEVSDRIHDVINSFEPVMA
ncbi:MAG: HEAT repeat domain-containing protein [Pyrinomonadaceae bacterium]